MTITLTTSPWLTQRVETGYKIALVLFSLRGRRSSIFRTWPQSLPKTVESAPLPSRTRQPPCRTLFHRLDPLVHAATEALLPFLNHRSLFSVTVWVRSSPLNWLVTCAMRII